jgi:hypothetical protein
MHTEIQQEHVEMLKSTADAPQVQQMTNSTPDVQIMLKSTSSTLAKPPGDDSSDFVRI